MKRLNPEERPRSRLWRWVLCAVAGTGAMGLVAIGVFVALVHNLETPWIKARIRGLLLSNMGVALDYGHVDVGLWSGVNIDGIVAQTPGRFAIFAPELARIGHVRARWSLGALLKPRPSIGEIEADGVDLTIVVDEKGASSIDAIPRTPSPPTPLSEQSRELIEESSPVRHLQLKNVTLRLIRTDDGTVVERDTLGGVSFEAEAKHGGSGRLQVALGSRTEPLPVRFDRWREGRTGEARAQVSLVANATPADAAASLDIRVTEQDLAPDVTVRQLVHLELQAQFDPARRQTAIELLHGNLGDGVLTVEGRAELPDEGSPVVRRAMGDLDAEQLLRLLPAGILPIELGRGRLHYRIEELAADHPSSSAKLTLDAEAIGAVHVEVGGSPIDGEDVAVNVGLERSPAGAWTGQADVRFRTIERRGKNPATARDGRAQVRVRDLVVDPRALLAARGDVSADVAVASLEIRGTFLTTLSDVTFRAHAPLSGAAPLAFDTDLDASRLAVAGANGKLLVDTEAHVELALKNVTADLDQPEKSSGEAHLGLRAGALEARLDATKAGDSATFEVAATARTLGAARLFAPADIAGRVPWDKMAAELHTVGSVERMCRGAPRVHQRTQLRLTGASFDAVRVPTLSFDLRSDGTATKHDATLAVDARSIAIADAAVGDDRLDASLSVDRALPSAHVELHNEGALQSKVTGSFAVDRTDRAVTYDIAATLAKLGPVAPLLTKIPGLAHFDFGDLALQLQSRGRLVGLVSNLTRQGDFGVASDAARAAGGEGTAELGMTKFRWSEGDRAYTAPAATLHASFHGEGGQRQVQSAFSAEELEIGIGRHHVTIAGLHDQTSASWTGAIGDGTIDLSHRAWIRAARQNFLAMYPIEDVTSTLAARLDTDGLFKISALRIENEAGGSTLSLNGGIDLSADQRRLSLRTGLAQDLARFSTRPERFTGRGNATIELIVESPDFRVFHGSAKVGLEGATIRLPRYGLALNDVDGEVPVVTDVTLGRRGLELLRDAHLNPYAVLRYADQHPLLSHRSFLSIGSVTTPMVSVAPFVANLRVDQNVISLSQLEMGVRGGSVTGNGILDWNGAKTKVRADLHASGVKSSHGEPFDGNAALVIDMGDRSIEGRADILRIGSRHLLDLLDLEDPHRANAGMNRIRSALDLGYPERVRIAFKHGFASAGVSLGGLASLVSVDDVRGIPIGPLMERIVRSLEPREEP